MGLLDRISELYVYSVRSGSILPNDGDSDPSPYRWQDQREMVIENGRDVINQLKEVQVSDVVSSSARDVS
jgi:hypothetical protein